MALAEEQSGGPQKQLPYSTNRVFTDDQGYSYEIFYDPATGQEFFGASINSSPDRYGTTGYSQMGASGYAPPPPPPPSGGGGGGGGALAAAPPPPDYGAPAPSYSSGGGGGGGGGYVAGPTYANGQASRLPAGPPPPPPTTTGFARSPWSESMGTAIGNFDPNAVPPGFKLPQPLPSSGGIPQPGSYKPSNLPAYQKKPGS